jgi:D-glycero-D-manno-heptose 1,7-bisphosphate phosphatase
MTMTAATGKHRAVFLDRDGVLIEDRAPLLSPEDIVLLPGAALALRRLRQAGHRLIVVSNQAVVARGLLTVDGVRAMERVVEARLRDAGAPALDGFYFCPHHPFANLPVYRQSCACRKPGPELLLEAAAAHDIDLAASVMIGDRSSDIVAGQRAGCHTIQLTSGKHLDPPIEVAGGFTPSAADFACATLADAADLILLGTFAGAVARAGAA